MLHKSFSVRAAQDLMTSSMMGGGSPALQHLVQPLSAQAKITRNCSTKGLKISDGPRFNVAIRIEEVPLVLCEDQMVRFVELSEVFKLRMRAENYRHDRPGESVREK